MVLHFTISGWYYIKSIMLDHWRQNSPKASKSHHHHKVPFVVSSPVFSPNMMKMCVARKQNFCLICSQQTIPGVNLMLLDRVQTLGFLSWSQEELLSWNSSKKASGHGSGVSLLIFKWNPKIKLHTAVVGSSLPLSASSSQCIGAKCGCICNVVLVGEWRKGGKSSQADG